MAAQDDRCHIDGIAWLWVPVDPGSRATIQRTHQVPALILEPGPDEDAPPRAVPGTGVAWRGLRGWLRAVFRVGGRIEPARRHYARCDQLYRSLRADDMQACTDIDALAVAEQLFRLARHQEIPMGYGLRRVMRRADLGDWIVRVHNRRVQLAGGRAAPREKGPALDPARLPDAALDRLIQRHPDLAVVDRLRDERRRRTRAAA